MYYLNPTQKDVHIAIMYRNFLATEAAFKFSHQGLGNNALHTARVLRKKQIRTDVFGVWTADHIEKHLTSNPTITTCLIEAPWVSIEQLQLLLFKFPNIHFIVRAHSELSFLQVEAGAITLIRKMLTLQEGVLNLTVSSNSLELTHFLEKTYQGHCLYLPNLYDLDRVNRSEPVTHNGKLLRISSFGAIRLMKNHVGSLGAALQVARERNCDLEFWVSGEREEHGKGVMQAMRNLCAGLPWAKLIENPWQGWPEFRRTVGHMDLCMQMSYSETFNLTGCDAVAEGIPFMGTNAIPWLPNFCHADPDSIEDIVRVCHNHLNSNRVAGDTFSALKNFNDTSVKVWQDYLSSNPGSFQDKSSY